MPIVLAPLLYPEDKSREEDEIRYISVLLIWYHEMFFCKIYMVIFHLQASVESGAENNRPVLLLLKLGQESDSYRSYT